MATSESQPIDLLAFKLLDAFKRHAERTREPAFAQDLGAEIGLAGADSERVFRYLAEKGWVTRFQVPYAGRICAQGYDAFAEFEKHHAVRGW